VFSFLLFFPCGLKGLIKYLNGLPAFFLFFFDGRVGHIVFGETDPLFDKRAKVERVVLNALAKQVRLCRLNLTSSNALRNAQKILRIRRLVLASSSAASAEATARQGRSRSTSPFTYESIDHPPPVFRFRAQTGSHRILPNIIHLC
jgi:hypothetical protein